MKRKLGWLMLVVGAVIFLATRTNNILDPAPLFGLILLVLGAVVLRLRSYPMYYPRELARRVDILERRKP